MKKMWNYFASILVMGLFAGCSNDTLTGDDSDGELNGSKDAVYMNVTVQLPAGGGSGARSETKPEGGSTDGEEMGKDYENEVKEVLLVLAKADDNTFIASGEVVTSMQSKNIVSSTQKISKTKLQSYYNTYASNGTLSASAQEVNVYIFCNPLPELREVFKNMTEANKKEWVNSIATVNETTDRFWGGANHKQGFLMSNATLAKKTLPATMDEWKDFSTESKAFNLSGINNKFSDAKVIDNTGNIAVERSVARFDFRDGSSTETGANTYDVVKVEAGEGETQTIVQIQLQKMALVNMSKDFYYLRRVSSNGLKIDASICGVETNGNYVVDTDADAKNGSIANFDFASHFNFCFGSGTGEDWTIDATARNGWYTSKISEVLAGEEDNVATPAVSDNRRYKIWRYVTENTIPNVNNQMYGISTGIVFKGKMLPTDQTEGKLREAFESVSGDGDTDAILYEYLGNLYVTWEEVRAAAITEGSNTAFYAAVFGTPNNTPALAKDAVGETTGTPAVYSDDVKSPDYLWAQWKEGLVDNALAFKHAATGAKFTLYQSSIDDDEGAGYYCYYYYWNRHNDNGEAGTMGPMEFAVVRNNVYKLSVTNIHRLGHPRIPENDPDKPKPDIPDEQDDIYLTLSVEVLPWVVRVNDIEF